MSRKHFSQMWKERALSMALLFMLSTVYMFAQKVTGVVKDSSGEPLIGVNVVEKGVNTNGAVTNVNGEYQINVAPGKTLVFSYIGYEKKEAVVKGTKLNVYLKEDAKVMGDVVVVGYGTMQRKDLTSSVTTVKADDLNKGVFTDPAQMLQGKVPGLIVTSNGDPNGTPSIILRGTSSFRDGAQSPYYVVDGIPGVDISMVAPDDIESIDILRDATATAIYGSKAANGVIMITTKTGKNGKTNVSYNAYVGFDQISNKLDMMDAEGLRSLSQYGITVDDNGGNTDWQKEVLRTGVSYNHNLSINGGTEKTKYVASVSYIDRKGIITGTDFSKLNVRTLLTTKVLKDHLDISLGGNLVYGKHQGVAMNWHGESVIDAMNYYSPLNPIYNADGSYYRVSVQPDKNYNPLSMINEDTGENNMKRQQFMAKATLHIVKGLDWNVNYAFNNYQRTGSTYNTHQSQVVSYKREGQANRNTNFGHDNKFETYGNYEAKWNDVNKLTAMLGYSWEETVYGDSFGLTMDTYYNDDNKWSGHNAANVTNGINGVSVGNKEVIRNISFYGRLNYSYNSRYMIQATMRRDGSSAFGANHRWGTFPSVSAAWNITEEAFMQNQELFSNLKLRAGYGVSGNAMGIGAYSSRLLYAVDHNSSFDYTKDGETKTMYVVNPVQNENRNLKWESTGMFNVGLDFAFMGGRINGTIEFYNKKTSDLIYGYEVMKGEPNYDGTPLPDGSFPGYVTSTQNVNVGDITNRGIEFSINAEVVKTRGFSWNTTLNLSHNTNKVDKLTNDRFSKDYITEGDPDVAGVSSNGYTQRIKEGEAIGTFYLYEFAGFENGRPVYYEHDEATGERTGKTITDSELNSTRDRVKAGTALPKLNIGWNNTFTYKNWNATVFFTGQFGNKIYNGTRASNLATSRLSGASGTKNVLADYVSEMVVDGKAVTDTNVPSDRWLENGSYLRLQTLTLGYTFRDCFNGWLKDIQLYGTVNNVFTLTSYKGVDPELRLGGTDPGIDYSWNVYPHTRTFMLGAKINF